MAALNLPRPATRFFDVISSYASPLLGGFVKTLQELDEMTGWSSYRAECKRVDEHRRQALAYSPASNLAPTTYPEAIPVPVATAVNGDGVVPEAIPVVNVKLLPSDTPPLPRVIDHKKELTVGDPGEPRSIPVYPGYPVKETPEVTEVTADEPVIVPNYEAMTVKALQALAKGLGLKGYTKLRKPQLIDLIRRTVK
jgi:hypothetical protein